MDFRYRDLFYLVSSYIKMPCKFLVFDCCAGHYFGTLLSDQAPTLRYWIIYSFQHFRGPQIRKHWLKSEEYCQHPTALKVLLFFAFLAAPDWTARHLAAELRVLMMFPLEDSWIKKRWSWYFPQDRGERIKHSPGLETGNNYSSPSKTHLIE